MWLNRKEDIEQWTRTTRLTVSRMGARVCRTTCCQRMKEVSVEEAWGVLKGHGYKYQYEGDWLNIHPDRVLVGRAVTASFVPTRPDLHELVQEWAKARGSVGLHNAYITMAVPDCPRRRCRPHLTEQVDHDHVVLHQGIDDIGVVQADAARALPHSCTSSWRSGRVGTNEAVTARPTRTRSGWMFSQSPSYWYL